MLFRNQCEASIEMHLNRLICQSQNYQSRDTLFLFLRLRRQKANTIAAVFTRIQPFECVQSRAYANALRQSSKFTWVINEFAMEGFEIGSIAFLSCASGSDPTC
ncbi:hypothetical protein RE6C_00833 [Rhodopirellula europaea 6C]|uniref:Uncharacterized protein n=1 Tax=Rhodopirellula europaea 6C TaxID=1263867 RepID=M2A8T4_9BACT|nr:hypothetical protein RE6C_00833 [Rhodopirellula europaea 6C]